MTPGQLTSLNGFIPFQDTGSLWDTDIPRSSGSQLSQNYWFDRQLHDTASRLGSGEYNGQSIMKTITGSDFEVVQMRTIYTPKNVSTGPAPTISSFTASVTSVSPGQAVTLKWTVDGEPPATTTYKLYSTNEFGRTTAKLTITVK